jgi:hypothetical protein
MKTDDGAGARKASLQHVTDWLKDYRGMLDKRIEALEVELAERGEVGSAPHRYFANHKGERCCDKSFFDPVHEVGSVGQGGRARHGVSGCANCESGIPCHHDETVRRMKDEIAKAMAVPPISLGKAEAQPEAGTVTKRPVCSCCGNRMTRGHAWQCSDCGTFIEASVAPSVEPSNRMLGEALGHVKTMQATLEQVFDLCDEWLQAPSLSKSSSLGILQRVCEIIHNETGRKSVRESESIEFEAVAPSVEELEEAAKRVINECPREKRYSCLYGANREFFYYKVPEDVIDVLRAALERKQSQ